MENKLNCINLKKAREAMGISKLEASKRMNIPQSSYVRYENGVRKPTQATIVQMAQVLNTSADYLMGKTDSQAADTIIIRKEDNPELFKILEEVRKFDDEKLQRFYAYFTLMKKDTKKKK
jgi:transcriptional regulator with XRE-family HTH domain